MKIFVTGGTGFVGSHLTHKLVYAGHEVTVGGLKPEKSVIDLPENVERTRVDITDPETLDFTGFDAVIHLVGLSPLKKPGIPYRKIHIDGTENVLKECKRTSVKRYIHMSALGADPDADTEYLRTKGEAQKIVEESDLSWTVFRPSVIFGEGGQFLKFTEDLTTPFITFLPGGGRNMFQPVNVEDMGDLFVESLERNEHIGKAYDIGGPEKLSMAEISKLIEDSKNRSLKVLPLPMILTKIGFILADKVDRIPFGLDQYRSLRTDNTVEKNGVTSFEKRVEDMKTLESYLN